MKGNTNKTTPHKMMTRNVNLESGTTESYLTSPMIRKLQKVVSTEGDTECATYKGIITKCFFFMAVLLLGAAFFFLTVGSTLVKISRGADIDLSSLQIILLIGTLLFSVIGPIIASLVRRLTPVFGTLSFFCTGALITFIVCVDDTYRNIILLAAFLTILLVFVMQIIYFTGLVKVTHRFRTGLTSLFVTIVAASLILLIMTFIPSTRPIVLFLQQSPLIYFAGSVVGLIIAVCFLLVDFNNVQEIVENRLPKEYEWSAAFGLSYTVVWIYFKVLDLLAQAKKNN